MAPLLDAGAILLSASDIRLTGADAGIMGIVNAPGMDAISQFQVLQHRMVDMFIQVEQSVSMTYMAHIKLGESAAERAKAVSAAKVQIGRACRFVGQNAIQLHGGMGMTDELAIGHYFKRLTMIENTFGDTDYHLRRVTNAGGLV